MRVLHLLGWYFPDSVGGTEVYVAELATRQRAAGMDVAVAAPEDAGPKERRQVGPQKRADETALSGRVAERRDVPVDSVRSYAWEGSVVFRYPTDAADEGFAAILQRYRPDVVHVHSLGTGIGLAQVIAARRIAHRVVFTAHLPAIGFICQRGTLLRWGRDICEGTLDVAQCSACALENRGLPRAGATLLTAIGRTIGAAANTVPGRLGTGLRMPAIIAANAERQRALLDHVDYFVALNETAYAIAKNNGAPAHKLAINRLGQSVTLPPKPAAAIAPTQRPVRIGFVGRLHETKGVAVALRAVAALPAAAAVTLEVYGPLTADAEAPLIALLDDAAARDPRIRVHGALERGAVAQVLRELDVLCCPSLTFENGPTIALEAHAVGTPVIGSRAGAIPEIVTDGVNGRVFAPGDWRALRDVLADLAGDPSIVDRWRDALPRARTMDDVATEYERLYELPVPA